jgi:hypothetical protein
MTFARLPAMHGSPLVIWEVISFVCDFAVFTTRSRPLVRRVLLRVRSGASSFKFRYPVFSLRSYSDCLHLLRRPLVHSAFPSVTCFRRQVWPVQVAVMLLYVRFSFRPWVHIAIFFYTIGPINLLQSSPAQNFKTFKVYLWESLVHW